jgi:hypothetical protein
LVVFDVFALAVFLAAGLAELPQDFLAAQPPFCAIMFTSFHNGFGFLPYSLFTKTNQGCPQAGYVYSWIKLYPWSINSRLSTSSGMLLFQVRFALCLTCRELLLPSSELLGRHGHA